METITYQAVPPLPLTAPLATAITPAAYLGSALDYLAALDERPAPAYVREVAALEEVITYPDDVQQARYDSHCARLLSGADRETATPTELRRDALALFGLARDRAQNGVWALAAAVWLEAADTAMTAYRRRQVVLKAP